MQYIDPTAGSFSAFLKQKHEGPVNMLNLLRFRERAAYSDGDRGLSGRDAYASYSAGAKPFLAETGAEILWNAIGLHGLIGPQNEVWDAGFIVRYPSKEAFVSMIMHDDYQAITHHRTAALENSRLYAFGELNEAIFGGGS